MFTNTLNHPTNSCNAFLAGETTMMGKEHFIETFGVPSFTVSTGGSGGAYTSLQVGDAFPGLFDGVLISATFPDALSIAEAGLDGHLLTHYFLATNPAGFTDAQRVAVTGYKGLQAWYDAANQMGRTDPVVRDKVRAYYGLDEPRAVHVGGLESGSPARVAVRPPDQPDGRAPDRLRRRPEHLRQGSPHRVRAPAVR